MDSGTAGRTPPGAKAVAVILVIMLIVPLVALLSGLFFYVAIQAWQSVLDLL